MLRIYTFFFTTLLFVNSVEAQIARVQLIHNSPDPDLAVIDLYLNGELFADDFLFHQATPFFDASTQSSLVIGLAFSDSDSPLDIVASYSYTLIHASKNVFVINGALNPNYQPIQPLTVYHLDQALEAAANPSATSFTFFNGSMDLGIADLHETELIQLPAFDNIGYGDFSEYLELFSADYELTVYDESGVNSYASYAAPFAEYDWGGQALTIVSSDFVNQSVNLNGEPLSLWAAGPAGGMMTELPLNNLNLFAQVQFIHNSPDISLESIDVLVNDNSIVNDLMFRHATSFINVPAAQEISLEIVSADGSPFPNPYSTSFSLISGERYLVITEGIVSSTGYNPAIPFDLVSLEGAKSVTNNLDEIEFCFIHGSTDAGDVNLNIVAPVNQSLIENSQFSEIHPYQILGANDFLVNLTNASGAIHYETYEANFSNLGGSAFAMILSGFLQPEFNSNGETLGLWLADADGGELIPLPIAPQEPVFAQVQFIHTSADEALGAIDLYVNGVLAISGFAFPEATGFNAIQVNEPTLIEIFPEGNSNPASILYSQTIDLMEGLNHRLMLSGILSESGYNPAPPFQFVHMDEAEISAASTFCNIQFYQSSTDLGQIDISDFLGSQQEWASNLNFGIFSDNLIWSANETYVFSVNETNDQFQYGLWEIPMSGYDLSGQAALIFSTGFINPANNSNGVGLAFYVVLNNGEVYPLDVHIAVEDLSKVNLVQLYPNPGNDFVAVKINSDQVLNELLVSDVTGKVLVRQSLFGSLNGQYVLDTKTLTDGVYTISVIQNNGVLNGKLIVSH